MRTFKTILSGLLLCSAAAAALGCGGSKAQDSTTPEGAQAGDLPNDEERGSKLYDAWAEPGYTGEKISKIMVMGIGDDKAVVDEFETAFAEMLTKAGVEAVKASNVISDEDRRNKDGIIAKKLEEASYTGALVTRLVSVDKTYEAVAPTASISGRPFLDYYQSSYANPQTMRTMDETVTVTLESALYKIPEAKIVWCGTTSSFNPTPDNRKRVFGNIGDLIIESLKTSGVLAVTP
jgi:hypothetical protein